MTGGVGARTAYEDAPGTVLQENQQDRREPELGHDLGRVAGAPRRSVGPSTSRVSSKKLVYLDGRQAVLCRSRMNPFLGRNFEAMEPLE